MARQMRKQNLKAPNQSRSDHLEKRMKVSARIYPMRRFELSGVAFSTCFIPARLMAE